MLRPLFPNRFGASLALCLTLIAVGPPPAAHAQKKASPLLMGYGPARMPVKVPEAATKTPIEGEFVLRQKYLENQYFRDEFHGWATGEGMWRGLAGSGGSGLQPAVAAMKGTSNPEADFTALLEAGWLDREQITKGFEVKQRHDRLSSLARAKVAEAQKRNDHAGIVKARRACADMDRAHYLEKKKLMAGVRKVLAERRPDLLCSGPQCQGNQAGARRGAPAPPSAPMMPPPMGGGY